MVKEASKFNVAGVHLSIQQISTEYLLCARHYVRKIKDTKKKKHGPCFERADASAGK